MKNIYTSLFLLLCMLTSALAQPIITTNPQNSTACIDSCAIFSAEAQGNGLSYVWFEVNTGGNDVEVGTGTELSLCDSVVQFDGASFYFIVTDMNGDSATSSQAVLTVDSCLAPIADFDYTWGTSEVCYENTSQYATTVIWLFGDGETDASNAQAPCHIYTAKELYYVKLRAFNDHGEDVVEKSVDLLAAGEASEEAFQAFPNPVRDMMRIQSPTKIIAFDIYDVNGRVVKSAAVNQNSAQINWSELEKGVYILKVETTDEIIQQRIIKS